MVGRLAVGTVTLIIILTILVSMFELLVPLSARQEFGLECRNALITMETTGGFSAADRTRLTASLTSLGFADISITATAASKLGDEISLRVEADYQYSRITGVFTRSYVTQRMVYVKTSRSREVIN
jgi:hypothetical protein